MSKIGDNLIWYGTLCKWTSKFTQTFENIPYKKILLGNLLNANIEQFKIYHFRKKKFMLKHISIHRYNININLSFETLVSHFRYFEMEWELSFQWNGNWAPNGMGTELLMEKGLISQWKGNWIPNGMGAELPMELALSS